MSKSCEGTATSDVESPPPAMLGILHADRGEIARHFLPGGGTGYACGGFLENVEWNHPGTLAGCLVGAWPLWRRLSKAFPGARG